MTGWSSLLLLLKKKYYTFYLYVKKGGVEMKNDFG